MKKAVNISSTTEEFHKIQRSTVSCLSKSTSVSAPIKEFKHTPVSDSKGLSPMKIGFGQISNASKTSQTTSNIDIPTWQTTSATLMECSNSIADGTSTF